MGDLLRKFYKEKRIIIKGLATILEMDEGEGFLRREFGKIIEVLQVKTYNRTPEQIDLLLRATSHFEIFKKFSAEDQSNPESIPNKCCKEITYKLVKKGTVLCRRGEYAKSMFFLIKGKVNVYAELKPPQEYAKPFVSSDVINQRGFSPSKSPDKRAQEPSPERRKNLLKRGASSNDVNAMQRTGSMTDDNLYQGLLEDNFHFEPKVVSSEVRRVQELLQDILLYDQECEREIDVGVYHDLWVQMECLLRYIGTIYPGKSFGDKEMTSLKPYDVTLIAAEDIHLGILHKKEFDNILIKAKKEKLAKKIDYFSGVFGFRASWKLVSELSYYLQKGRKFAHQMVYNENDKVNGIYFIRKGQITLYKNPPLGEKEKKRKKEELDDLIQKRLKPERPFPIQTLKKFDVFGEEFFLDKTSRLYSASVSSEILKYYFFPLEKIPHILERYPDIRRELLTQAKQRYIFREERFSKNGEIYAKILEQSPTRRREVAPVRRTSHAIDEAYAFISHHEDVLKTQFKSAPNSPSKKDHIVNPYFPQIEPFSNDTMNRVEQVVDFNKKFLEKKKAEYSVGNSGEFIDISKGNILGEKSIYFYKDREPFVSKHPSFVMGRSQSLPRFGRTTKDSLSIISTGEKVRKMLNLTMMNSTSSTIGLRKTVLEIPKHISKMEFPKPESEDEVAKKLSTSDKAFQTAKLQGFNFANAKKDFNLVIRGLTANTKQPQSVDPFKASQSQPSSPRHEASLFNTFLKSEFMSSREPQTVNNSIIREDESRMEATDESAQHLKTIVSQLPHITEKEEKDERIETKNSEYQLQPAKPKKKIPKVPNVPYNEGHVYLMGNDIQVNDFLPEPISFKHKHSDQRPDGSKIMKLREKLLDPLYKLRKFIVPPFKLTSVATNNSSRDHLNSWVEKGNDTNMSVPTLNQTMRDVTNERSSQMVNKSTEANIEIISAPMTLQTSLHRKKMNKSSTATNLSTHGMNMTTPNLNTSKNHSFQNEAISAATLSTKPYIQNTNGQQDTM